MYDLEKTLKIKWPKKEKITCHVGLLPVCPRDIEGRTFIINYGINKENLIATCIHEICHFFYFEKWKEIYPNYKNEEFENKSLIEILREYVNNYSIDEAIKKGYELFKKYENTIKKN